MLLPAGAALALAAGTAVYLSNRQDDSVHTSVAMHATAAAPRASAVLTVGGRDRSGNWSITLHVRGLPALPRGSVYEMYVTDEDRLVGSCGVFRTDGKPTVVEFNVPYTLADDSGWLIRREQPHRPPSAPLLTTQT